ncbi:MAG TPA: phosphate signaling complex protein PhoU [Xanthobacteraceae bacterium]|jgi:phosphate transport system protein|nr:phosphate signaling complex protein PhoU [Xanthobacteraceae bacterium]
MTEHTVKAFDADLDHLMKMVAKMGEQVEATFRDAVEVLIRRDDKLAKDVLDRGEANNALHREIESGAVLLIARRQPVAYDLRLIVAIWETAIELSHIGDLAKNIVGRLVAPSGSDVLAGASRGLRRIARAALRRLHDAVDSLVKTDAEKAERLWRSDQEIDAIYSALCRELLTYMMSDPQASPAAVNLLFCAKSIESVGDHVTNIADAVHYLVQGRRIEGVTSPQPA